MLLLLQNIDLALIAKPGPVPAISEGEIGDIKVTFPPPAEQAAIIEYVDKATAGIDDAITHAHRHIELLQEYRARLIADVVTGKLDVREIAPLLPNEDDDGQDPIIEESNPPAGGLSADPQDPAALSFIEA